MVAEEQKYDSTKEINVSIPLGKTISFIIESFKDTTLYFKNHISQFTHKLLNEDELTQEFVNLLRRKTVDSPFLVGQEKKDLYHYAKGRADFYFYSKEETATTESFFDVEAKILTDRFSKERKKEYVIGNNRNGGIERFKIEKHGKGLSECGIIGFIEKGNFDFWETTINGWIKNLAKFDIMWNENEILRKIEHNAEFVYLNSKVNTITSKNILLHHFWISNLS
jgi:hypothetical protein